MSVNRFRPHLLVIPEDDANRQLANGFALGVLNGRKLQVLTEVGGWIHVLDDFLENQQKTMREYPSRYVILLLDFDGDAGRRSFIQARIPDSLKDRVFVMGVKTDPESLRHAWSNTFEEIGQRLAAECCERVRVLWNHDLLKDNAAELDRMQATVCRFLFDPD